MANSILEEKEYQSKAFDRSCWVRMLKILWEEKKVVLCLLGANLIFAVTDIIFPLFNRYAIDTYVVGQASQETLPVFITVYVVGIVVRSVSLYLYFRYAGGVESSFGKNLRKKCFVKLQNLSFPYFDRTANGWLMARVTSDTGRLAEILAWSLMDLIWGAVLIVGITGVMLAVNWQMALAILIIVPFLWFITMYFQKLLLSAQRKSRKSNSKITAGFSESISGAKTTKTLGIEQENYDEFKQKTHDMRTYSMRAARINSLFQPIVFLLSGIVLALLVYIGGNQVLLSVIQFGTLSMFISYAELFFEPLKQIARVLGEMQMAQASGERILSLLDEEVEIDDSDEVKAIYGTLLEPKEENYEPLLGNVEFKHVDFFYNNENEKVLTDFNLKVNQGEMIALVGETGSGKSTIVNLLCRFYEPKNGQIFMDGRDIQERSVGWLHSNIGYVLQTPNLFSGSIRDNIRYGRPSASDEEVEEVAKLIHAHDFIIHMPKGYDSEVGEGGDMLSTGQKQLLSFARALLSDPSIVILDEATSSIDTESEKVIQLAIKELLAGRTSFVVAHRLSTIVNADKILVLDHGVIKEIGTHEELMKKKGAYYELYTSQSLIEKQQQLLSTDLQPLV